MKVSFHFKSLFKNFAYVWNENFFRNTKRASCDKDSFCKTYTHILKNILSKMLIKFWNFAFLKEKKIVFLIYFLGLLHSMCYITISRIYWSSKSAKAAKWSGGKSHFILILQNWMNFSSILHISFLLFLKCLLHNIFPSNCNVTQFYNIHVEKNKFAFMIR